MAEANNQLRAARQRTASPTNPRMGLSRQELADLVNAWVWKNYKKTIFATANYIGKIETGLIRWPDQPRREAFRAILNVLKDSDLGFINARSERAAVKLENVDRQNLIRGGAALTVSTLIQGPPAALRRGRESNEPTPVPKRVGATDIEHTRTTTRVFQSWSYACGGGPVRDAVMGQLDWSAGLLDATCPAELSPELHSAVGALADTAGYVALDAGANAQALWAFRLGLACAEKAKDWSLRAKILTDMAVQEIWTGQPDEGLTLTELALVRSDRLTEIERALVYTDQAKALAKMRRVQETLTAIGTADDHFARSTPDNAPPLMGHYNAAFHTANTGYALVDLALLGHEQGKAIDLLTAAVAGLTTSCARPLARCQARLASLTMATGDPLQAAAIGHEALDITGTIRSRTAADDLRELSRHAATHQKLDEVAHLRHRITTLLLRTDSP